MSVEKLKSNGNGNGHELKIVKDATCTFCGCVCDDIDLTVDGHQIIEAKRACVLGKAWFLNHDIEDRPACSIDGQPASVAEGIERASQILANAKYPLIYGLSDTTSESQRVAVGIADWIGGNVDTTTSVCHGPSGMAFQGVGEVTASLGEVRNRGDLIMFWGSNPAESHPRHFTKYSLMPKGHVPAQRPQGPDAGDRRRPQDEVARRPPTSSFRSSRGPISRRSGRCGPWPRASSSIRCRSKPTPACRCRSGRT